MFADAAAEAAVNVVGEQGIGMQRRRHGCTGRVQREERSLAPRGWSRGQTGSRVLAPVA